MRSRKHKHRYRKWMIRSVFVIVFLMISIVGYTFYKLNNIMDKMYNPVERIETGVSDDKNLESRAFLLLGIDKDSKKRNDIGRTDVIMIAIVNEKTKKITLTSIPRDTYVEIAGQNYKDKINAAYQYGIATTIATVENFTDIHIDNYILTNYDGIYRAIKAIGGIRLYVDKELSDYTQKKLPYLHFPDEGYHLLNADQALYFARFRHDTKGDFGRNDRQQQFIKAFIDQSTEVRSPLKIDKFLDAIGNGISTDLTKGEIISLASQLKNYTSDNIESIHYRAYPDRFGSQNLWYVLIPEQERERVSALLKERLNADENTVLTDPSEGFNKEFSKEEMEDIKRQEEEK
ncbi:LCP family protein [Tepidibacillus sp. LV47]|uniref:LCP family protein n=1 Tax=Tepidibacillus sp. LV47 TaxID=3398228 RepID=UPI003AACDE7A